MQARWPTDLRVRWTIFLHASQGAVAVEFAMIGLPFLMLMLCILCVGFILYCTAMLDYAVQRAGRQLLVGKTQGSGLTAGQFQNTVLCPMLPSAIFDCSKVLISLKSFTPTPQVYNPTLYYQFVKADRSGLIVPTAATFCLGGPGAYQVLEVTYPLPQYLSLFASSPQVVNGQFLMMSSLTFKNEPFQSGGGGC